MMMMMAKEQVENAHDIEVIHFCHLLYGDATTTTTIIHQYNHTHPPMTVSIAIAAPVSPSFV